MCHYSKTSRPGVSEKFPTKNYQQFTKMRNGRTCSISNKNEHHVNLIGPTEI